MKKLLAVVAVLILIAGAFYAGTQTRKQSAADVISHMEIWAINGWEGEYRDGRWWYSALDDAHGDGLLEIYCDGEWYEHWLYIG